MTPSYILSPTDQLRQHLVATTALLASADAMVATLEAQLDAARTHRASLQETLEPMRDHQQALLRWRERTKRDDGDPIAELAALIARITASSEPWTLDHYDEPAGSVQLRAPDGMRYHLTFRAAKITLFDDAGGEEVHERKDVNRPITRAWIAGSAAWVFALQPARRRGEIRVVIDGDIERMEVLP